MTEERPHSFQLVSSLRLRGADTGGERGEGGEGERGDVEEGGERCSAL